jgi:HAD superfamily hydrolase (TIGR01509 family)
MPSNIEAVLFDLDGTLIDASEVICNCFNAALTKYDLQPLPSDTIKVGIGRPLRDLFAEQGQDMSVDLLVEEYKRVFAELAPGRSCLMPGARELLAALSKQKKLGIVTSRSSAGTSKILKDLDLLDCFSTLVGIEDVTSGKPSPAPVLLALQNLAVRAHNSAFVGDTTYDMEAGHRAGTRTIGVTTGSHNREQLLTAGADFVVRDLFSLRCLLSD